MDSDASYRDAGEALSFSLGTPTGAGITKKTRVVRRGSKRMREETEADEIRVRDPAVFNGAGRILLRAIVEEFNKAQAEQDAKYNIAIRETHDAHINQIRDITQKINEKHHKETEKTNKKHQDETKKNAEKHQNDHQKFTKQVQELQKQLEESKIKEIREAMQRMEEQLTQMSIAGSGSPTTVTTNPASPQPRQTWSQVASQKGPSPQHSARTELLSDSEASHAQPLANEGKTIEIDISRARGDKDDINKVKDT
jgi:flagellar biosynthesis GTPase FlhF